MPSLNAYPAMRDNETVKATVEKLIEAYPESLVLSPTEDEVMQTLNMAGVAADRKRLDGIYQELKTGKNIYNTLRAFEKITLKMIQMKLKCHILTRQLHM